MFLTVVTAVKVGTEVTVVDNCLLTMTTVTVVTFSDQKDSHDNKDRSDTNYSRDCKIGSTYRPLVNLECSRSREQGNYQNTN